MDKLKDLASKAKGSSSNTGSTGSSGGGGMGTKGGPEDNYINKGVDMFTDKAGMGDKYDSKISDQANKQFDNRMGK